MDIPPSEDLSQMVAVREVWSERPTGVFVKRWLVRKDGSEKYLGEELTPHRMIPFVVMGGK